jgi:hypothetical protein
MAIREIQESNPVERSRRLRVRFRVIMLLDGRIIPTALSG